MMITNLLLKNSSKIACTLLLMLAPRSALIIKLFLQVLTTHRMDAQQINHHCDHQAQLQQHAQMAMSQYELDLSSEANFPELKRYHFVRKA